MVPPKKWVDKFDRVKSMPRGAWWRSISVEGDYLVIDCRPQEVGAYLATMKRDVKNASRRYNAMMQARHKHSGREMQSHELELQLTRRDWWARVKWFVRNLGENLWL
jgi:hypothetical protein